MTELLESVCKEFGDYAQARHKETNEIETIKLVENGVMNPRFNEYEMVQDPDLNKGIQFHCESIVEDFEDELMEFFTGGTKFEDEASLKNFCTNKAKLCPFAKNEL